MARAATNGTKKGQRLPTDAAVAQSPPKKHKKLDASFLIIIFMLVTYGIIMVFSASYASAQYEKLGDSMFYISRQLLFAGIGIIAMFIASYVDYHIYRRLVFWIFGLSFLLLVAVPFVGTDQDTVATRWIAIGSITFQPSEIMKFAIIVLFSHLIALNYKRMGTFAYGAMPFGVCLLTVAGLMMLQPHLSGTILIFSIGFIMMYIGGTKLRYFMLLAACGGAGIFGVIAIKGVEYISKRLTYWLHPFADVQDETWQAAQSLVAIGSGGIMGRGIGMSRQKYLYLPEPQNDYIFAIICEELGIIGALFVIVLFIMFALRGFSIASKAPDKFGYMLGVGLTVQVCIQAILNIAVVTSTVPATGISLPFFSYGGTALLMQLGQMGIMLNISRQATMEKT